MILNEREEEQVEGREDKKIDNFDLKVEIKIKLIGIDEKYYDQFSIHVFACDIKATYMKEVITLIDNYPLLSDTDREELFDFCSTSKTSSYTYKCWGTTSAYTFFQNANKKPSRYRNMLEYNPNTHELHKKDIIYDPYYSNNC